MQNLITNPDFHVDLAGWTSYADATATWSTEVAGVGGQPGVLKSVAGASLEYGAYFDGVANPPQNAIYRGRSAVRGVAATSPDLIFNTIQERGGASGNVNGPTTNRPLGTAFAYAAYSIRKVTAADRTSMPLFVLATAETAGDILYIDDAVIHRLDTALIAGTIIGYGPVGYYMLDDLDETETANVMDPPNFATVSSSVLKGVAPLARRDIEGNAAMSFDNSLGNNVNGGQNYKFLGNAAYSVCCWFRLDAFNSGSGHWIVNALDTQNGWAMSINANNQIEHWRGNTGGGANQVYTHPSSHVGQIMFCCIRYDGTNKHIDVNGVADVVSAQASSESIASHTAPFIIGAYSGGGSGFHGPIDEVAVFDYDIGGTASTAIYNAGTLPERESIYIPRRRYVRR